MPLHLCLVRNIILWAGGNLGKIILISERLFYCTLHSCVTYLSFCHPPETKCIIFFYKCFGLDLVAMHFILLHWRGSFVLKLNKLNQGIDKDFPRSRKLILWLSATGELHFNIDC